jgi:hypothetical protein
VSERFSFHPRSVLPFFRSSLLTSVSQDEREVAHSIATWLDALGYHVFLQDVPLHGPNVWAYRNAEEVDIVLVRYIYMASHTISGKYYASHLLIGVCHPS